MAFQGIIRTRSRRWLSRKFSEPDRISLKTDRSYISLIYIAHIYRSYISLIYFDILEKIGSVNGIDADKVKDYLGFQVKNSVRLVVPADLVVEAIALNCDEICSIPGVTNGILGVINYQGQLVWVIDLGEYLTHLLGLASAPSIDENSPRENKLTNTLTNTLTGVAIALPGSQSDRSTNPPPLIWVVSELHGIVSLNSAKFRPLPSQFISLLGAYFSGLTEINPTSPTANPTTVAILNMNRLFSALESQSREIAAIWET